MSYAVFMWGLIERFLESHPSARLAQPFSWLKVGYLYSYKAILAKEYRIKYRVNIGCIWSSSITLVSNHFIFPWPSNSPSSNSKSSSSTSTSVCTRKPSGSSSRPWREGRKSSMHNSRPYFSIVYNFMGFDNSWIDMMRSNTTWIAHHPSLMWNIFFLIFSHLWMF